MSFGHKIFIGFFATIGAVILISIWTVQAFSLFVALERSDLKSYNDSDLRVKKMVVQESDNAYPIMLQAKEVLKVSEADSDLMNDTLNGKNWNEPAVKKLLDTNRQALVYFDQMTEKRYFVDPNFDPETAGVDYTLIGFTELRKLARLQLVKAELMSKQGNDKQALIESIKVVKFGEIIMNSQPTLIQYLVGLAIKNMGLQRMEAIVDRGKLDKAFLATNAADLAPLRDSRAGLKLALKQEYMFSSQVFEEIMKNPEKYNERGLARVGTMRSFYYWKPMKTKKLDADLARGMIKHVEAPCGKANSYHREALINTDNKIRFLLTENAIGKTLVEMISVSLGSTKQKVCDSEALFDRVSSKMVK
ncbi:MAG: hypothetical protein Q7S37_01310 [bacterium]|nr:hypothetical protein [bacterium]